MRKTKRVEVFSFYMVKTGWQELQAPWFALGTPSGDQLGVLEQAEMLGKSQQPVCLVLVHILCCRRRGW